MYAEQEDVFYYITADERELRAPGHAARAPRRASSRACTCCSDGRGRQARRRRGCSCWARGTILREVIAAAELLATGLRRRRRHLELPELHRAAPRGAWRSSAGTCCIPTETPRKSLRRARASRAGTGRWSPRPTTCARSPTRSAPSCRGRYRVLGTDGFGRSDYRAQAARLLRGRPALGRAGGARGRWPTRARSRPPGRRGDQEVRHRSGEAGTLDGLSARRAASTTEPGVRSHRATEESATWHRRHEVKVPDIGDFKDVPVIEIHVKPGDAVKAEDPLVTLEIRQGDHGRAGAARRHGRGDPGQGRRQGERGHADPAAARRRRRRAGDPAALGDRAAGADARRRASSRPRRPPPRPQPRRRGRRPRRAELRPACMRARSVRRLARELGVDLAKVKGTGEKGRITKEDVQGFLRGPAAARGRGRGARGRHGHPRDPGRRTSRSSARSRPGRWRASRSISGPHPAPRLAQRPARHPQRRGGHHRARGLPQGARRRARPRRRATGSRCWPS